MPDPPNILKILVLPLTLISFFMRIVYLLFTVLDPLVNFVHLHKPIIYIILENNGELAESFHLFVFGDVASDGIGPFESFPAPVTLPYHLVYGVVDVTLPKCFPALASGVDKFVFHEEVFLLHRQQQLKRRLIYRIHRLLDHIIQLVFVILVLHLQGQHIFTGHLRSVRSDVHLVNVYQRIQRRILPL